MMKSKYSIRRQFAAIFILILSAILLLGFLGNSLFLERYYIRQKTKVIYQAYRDICNAATDDAYASEEFQERLNEVSKKYDIAIYIMDVESDSRFVSENGGAKLAIPLYGYLMGVESFQNRNVIEETDNYVVQRIGGRGEGAIEMYGRLDSGISFLMRTALESIRESAHIANMFMIYVGIFGVVLGGLLIWYITGTITKPILVLNNISERMVNLDFDAKYQGNSKTEIGLLGRNMNKLSQSLEKSISELKTANRELQLDIERRDKAEEMRREFLSAVSHELKTPIALIRGYAEGLQEGMGEDAESRDYYCNVIIEEATKMNTMVQNMMALNKLEYGHDLIQMERFDIVELLESFLHAAEVLVQKEEIETTLDAPDSLKVWADEYMIEEAFRNYFMNAVHYCSGDKQIRVSVGKEGRIVRVSVFNTGDPIPEEALPRIWEKFYKVDKARTREYGGSGVGLSIVKATMELHNQKYGVENRKDGVLFWFELESAEDAQNGADRSL